MITILFHSKRIVHKEFVLATGQTVNCEDFAPNFGDKKEHDFQDAFKIWQKGWERCTRAVEATSRVVVATRPKASFNQMAAPALEIMDGSLYVLHPCNVGYGKIPSMSRHSPPLHPKNRPSPPSPHVMK
jgi:hypothetical protein